MINGGDLVPFIYNCVLKWFSDMHKNDNKRPIGYVETIKNKGNI